MNINKLSELIDATKKPNGISIPECFFEGDKVEIAKRLISGFSEITSGTICFKAPFEKIPDCKIAAEMVRLPYEKMWLEMYDDASTWGFWCRQTPNGIQVLQFAISLDHRWVFCGAYIVKSEENQVALFTNFGLDDDVAKSNFTYFSQYLSALNCCNIKKIEHKPKPSQQSVRRALGRYPLFSTWTLELDLCCTEKEISSQGSSGSRASPRLHLRRGHAKQHKPGQWIWVQPHVVGDKTRGLVHKDYSTN